MFSQLAHHIFSVDDCKIIYIAAGVVYQDPHPDQFETPYQAAWKRKCLRILRLFCSDLGSHLKSCTAARLLYLTSRGLAPEEAVSLVINGFCQERSAKKCFFQKLNRFSTCYICSLQDLELMSRQLASRMFLTNCRWSLLQRWAVPEPCG